VRVAVLGATGLVGREMVAVLEQRSFPVDELLPLASERSAGVVLPFHGESVSVRAVSEDVFEGVDLALFSAGSGPSRTWAPVARSKGAWVVDNSSAWRMAPDVSLVVPEVNAGTLPKTPAVIANPNCATIQTVVALNPLHQAAGLLEFAAVTFQSVSGTGQAALRELAEGSSLARFERGIPLGGEERAQIYPHPVAFNALPHIGGFDDEGISEEEWKMVRESRKILGLPELPVSCTTVRVPVFRGHAVAVTAVFRDALSPDEAREILRNAPGVVVEDDPGKSVYPLPRRAAGTDPVYVGRIRRDTARRNALALWVVSDNLRKGAALNAVQIGETLLEKGLFRH